MVWAACIVLAAVPFDLLLIVRQEWAPDWAVALVLIVSVPAWGGLAYLVDRSRRRIMLIVAAVGAVARVVSLAVVLFALDALR